MPAEPLTALEREEIRAGIVRGEPDGVIAGRLGRHRLTINAEVRRKSGRDDYRATAAQDCAERQRLRPKAPKLVADLVLTAHVTTRLEAKDSPMTIARELAAGTNGVLASISHGCIYQAVYGHSRRGLRKGLHAHLHRRRRCRKRRLPPGEKPVVAGPLKDFNLIAARPEVALGRSEVGHLEGDLIVGAFNRSAIATVFDRASRHVWLTDLREGHGAQPVLAALIELLERIPEWLRRTLTWDQGREMAEHALLADATGIDIYFVDPHSPWQRPTNENGNGLLRRYVGKGTDLSVYTPQDLRAIEHRLNTMPRRSLGWSTFATAYAAAVAMTG